MAEIHVPSFIAGPHKLTPELLTALKAVFPFMAGWEPHTGDRSEFSIHAGQYIIGLGTEVRAANIQPQYKVRKGWASDGTNPLAEIYLPEGNHVVLGDYIPEGTQFLVGEWLSYREGEFWYRYTLHGRNGVSYPLSIPSTEEEIAQAIAREVGVS